MLMGKLKKQGEAQKADAKKAGGVTRSESKENIDDEDLMASSSSKDLQGQRPSSKEGLVPRLSKSLSAASTGSSVFLGRRPSKDRPSKQAIAMNAALDDVEAIIAHVESTRRSSVATRKQSAVSVADDALVGSPGPRKSIAGDGDRRKSIAGDPTGPRKSIAGLPGARPVSREGDLHSLRRSSSKQGVGSRDSPPSTALASPTEQGKGSSMMQRSSISAM
jgi:hypothetical protein